MTCGRVRGLFGAYWDDEITQAEREWMDSHFASCAACREQYEEYTRTLELVASLPREEAAAGFVERVVARAHRAGEVPDRLPSASPSWVPVAAGAALAALVFAAVIPWLRLAPDHGRVATQVAPVSGQTAGVVVPAPQAASAVPSPRATSDRSGVAQVSDSIFDHTEDVEFILDPVTPHRASARAAAHRAAAVQGERAVITF